MCVPMHVFALAHACVYEYVCSQYIWVQCNSYCLSVFLRIPLDALTLHVGGRGGAYDQNVFIGNEQCGIDMLYNPSTKLFTDGTQNGYATPSVP